MVYSSLPCLQHQRHPQAEAFTEDKILFQALRLAELLPVFLEDTCPDCFFDFIIKISLFFTEFSGQLGPDIFCGEIVFVVDVL